MEFVFQKFLFSGVCLVRSLSRQEFVFQEFVFPEFVIQEFVTAPCQIEYPSPFFYVNELKLFENLRIFWHLPPSTTVYFGYFNVRIFSKHCFVNTSKANYEATIKSWNKKWAPEKPSCICYSLEISFVSFKS